MGTPSWPNHDSVFSSAGLIILTYPHTDATGYRVNIDAVVGAARQTRRNDLFLLHATCHNPTGIDLSSEELQEVFECLQKNGAVPLLDLAYAGFGDTFAADCEAVRAAIGRFDEVAVCFSCSKNLGLYRERLGALIVKSRRPSVLEGALANIARADYSQPADHAASVVNIVLRDPALRQAWLDELDSMRARMFEKRRRLSQAENLSPALAHLNRGRGMFALLPLKPAQCRYLREQESIYLPDNGRINILGVPDQLEADFALAIERARNWQEG
jgi:aromatic-amino-acid transaminase